MERTTAILQMELPSGLTKEEFESYYKKFHLEGDLEAREQLILHNTRLVINYVMKKFPYNQEELISVGFLGLIKSVDQFDIAKNVKFSSFAMVLIQREIWDYLNGKRRIQPELSEDALASYEKQTAFIEDGYEIVIDQMTLSRILEDLDDKRRRIVQLYFGFNQPPKSQTQIAEMLGMTKAGVSKSLRKALCEIRETLLEADECPTPPLKRLSNI